MKDGAITLRELPGPYVEIGCTKCPNRKSLLRLDRLKERFGNDYKLPDMLVDLADCPRRGNFHDGCAAYYPRLKPAE